MSKMDYAKIFNLKPEESTLHILVCVSSKGKNAEDLSHTDLPRAEFINAALLPNLPFRDQNFDLVLCHHALFKENDLHAEEFDKKALIELARVGSEVRILPVVGLNGSPSQYLGPLIQNLQEQGIGIELRQVQINQEEKAQAMLRLWNATCEVSDH